MRADVVVVGGGAIGASCFSHLVERGVRDVLLVERTSLASGWWEGWPVVESRRPREAPLDFGAQAHTRADHFGIVYRQTYAELVGTARAGAG